MLEMKGSPHGQTRRAGWGDHPWELQTRLHRGVWMTSGQVWSMAERHTVCPRTGVASDAQRNEAPTFSRQVLSENRVFLA